MSENAEPVELVAGPLARVRVVELAGMGPSPHAAMMLADMGADVVRVQRPAAAGRRSTSALRGRTVVEADLKDPNALAGVRRLITRADVLIEGFRPGVAERLGLGPDECRAANPRLVYVRVTGWGQTGVRAAEAGHDINYISLTGALHAIGFSDRPPVPPLNLLGDYGGGSMLAVVGVLAALVERQSSGRGQVVDAAMVDGVVQFTHAMWALRADNRWSEQRGANIFDGSCPFYRCYECADGRYVAVGALEPEFFAELLAVLQIEPSELGPQRDQAGWPNMHRRFAEKFAQRPRDEWVAAFAGADACVTPVLTMAEAAADPHLVSRGVLVDLDGRIQPAPAPRFARTPSQPRSNREVSSLNEVWSE
jgi:alpha-methylacyl-CoA racemase